MKILVSFILIVSTAAFSADNPTHSPQEKAKICSGCHGNAGITNNKTYPNLAGQNAQYIEKQLKAFQKGDRNDPIMSPMSKSLTNSDITILAKYYSSLK